MTGDIHPLFLSLPAQLLHNVITATQQRSFRAGSIIAGQGTPCEGLFCIRQGLVQFAMISTNGNSTFIGIEKNGNYFGDCELLLAQAHFATISAITDCKIDIVPVAVFNECLTHAAFACDVARSVAQHLQLLQWVQMARHQFSAERQIANIILYLGQHFGHATAVSTQIDVHLTQDQLADMAGVSRQAIHKPLQQWKQNGWIDYQYGRLLICNAPALQKIASGA